MQNDTTTSWITIGRNFQTSKKCKTTFILEEFFKNKSIEWNLHVDSTPGLHRYDMILGHDIMSELRIMLNFKEQTMTWDDSTINMKDPESLPDLLDPVNDFFWSNDHYETEALQEASAHLQKILDVKFALADLNAVIQACRHLMEDEMLYFANTNIYLMELWEHGIMNPIILNLRKGLSCIIADLSIFQKFISAL